jgi:RNA polymerase sigma-70 factor (ECF subfamily)
MLNEVPDVENRRTDDEARASDLALVGRVVSGDEAALGSLYDRYGGLVYSVALRVLRDAQAAEEILQDIFHHLWRVAGRFDSSRGSLPGWLLVTTRNRSIDRLRRRTPESTSDQLFENVSLPRSAGNDLESSVAQSRLLERVNKVIAKMPETQRELIELAYFEGLTHSEIAERTGEPLGTVKSRLRAGIACLKKEMQS